MTEPDTLKNATHAIIKKLNQEKSQLEFDDKLFYDFIKCRMDGLIQKPKDESVAKILEYSKSTRNTVR